MEATWILKNGEKKVQLTRNSFKRIMDGLDTATDDAFIQINDGRFDGGEAILVRKSEILALRCPASELTKWTNARNKGYGGSEE